MAGPTRTSFQREHDLVITASLYCQGMYQSAIAKKIGVSQKQISYDLRVIQHRWQQSMVADFDARKARELAKIDETERQAWRGWRRSLKDAVKNIKSAKSAPPSVDAEGHVVTGQIVEAREEREGQAGDPRFLAIVQGCIERRCKIFGIDAPTKGELTGKDGGPIEVRGFDYAASITALAPRSMGDSEPSGADESDLHGQTLGENTDGG